MLKITKKQFSFCFRFLENSKNFQKLKISQKKPFLGGGLIYKLCFCIFCIFCIQSWGAWFVSARVGIPTCSLVVNSIQFDGCRFNQIPPQQANARSAPPPSGARLLSRKARSLNRRIELNGRIEFNRIECMNNWIYINMNLNKLKCR